MGRRPHTALMASAVRPHHDEHPKEQEMPAYFDTGFSVREPMWHGEGMVLDDYPTDWDDAREKAGLLWEPTLVPCYFRTEVDRTTSPSEGEYLAGESMFTPLVDHQLVTRDDTGAALGVVSDQFGLVYHKAMGEILEAILGQPNVKFETAGSCKGGAQVWALAYIDEPYTVPGDDSATYPFVALLNSHDGSGACKVTRTQIRVVCWNTYQAASMQGERSGLQFVFRHAGDVQGRIDEAIKALAGARTEASEWTALATELFGMKVDQARFNHFLVDFIPEPPAEIVSDRVRGNIDRARKVFSSLYLDSVTTEAHRGTALGLVDASVEYLDHVRGYRNHDSYLNRTLLRTEPLKARALKLAREVCA